MTPRARRLHGEVPVRTCRFPTLADVIPARDEVKWEAQILTVERRTSAYVLAGPSSSASGRPAQPDRDYFAVTVTYNETSRISESGGLT